MLQIICHEYRVAIEGVKEMKIEKKGGAFADTRIAKFLDKRITEMASRKSQLDISRECGFTNPNVISIMKSGAMKVPLDRIPALAKSLECDPVKLFKMGMEQSFNAEAIEDILKMFNSGATKNLFDWQNALEEVFGTDDPEYKPEYLETLKTLAK